MSASANMSHIIFWHVEREIRIDKKNSFERSLIFVFTQITTNLNLLFNMWPGGGGSLLLFYMWPGGDLYYYFIIQCLGSVSVGSARFWVPGSGSAKIYRSPDPRGKISIKRAKKLFYSQNPNLNYWKREIINISLIYKWFIKF